MYRSSPTFLRQLNDPGQGKMLGNSKLCLPKNSIFEKILKSMKKYDEIHEDYSCFTFYEENMPEFKVEKEVWPETQYFIKRRR